MVFNRETSVAHEQRPACRHDWTQDEVLALFRLPFNDLIFQAQTVHRAHFNANEVQISTLLSIKTGGCPEDCAYCPQSAHFDTGLKSERLMSKEVVLAEAERAKLAGASRFCMGAAWRAPKDSEVDEVAELVAGVKALGLETCATLGMLTRSQAERLKDAGLDYYNHNLDTSESYYDRIITTRTYQDRLDTLARVREAGIHVCCGGILGMGEGVNDHAAMLRTLANLPEHPESVPINMLVRVEGTPLADAQKIDPLDFVRTIAVARILMPASFVRLSAGREAMTDELQALCFLAGANSIFFGEKLLTTPNPAMHADQRLFERLGLRPLVPEYLRENV
jgi:biotin synthase